MNIVRRALLGLQSVGVDRVLAMPDSSHLVRRAADDPHLSVEVDLLRMTALYNEGDTVRAAAAMSEEGVNCLITLGGDGTNRAVAKGSRDMPMVAISTGTNNVFPVMVEGTIAGMAAGLVASGVVPLEEAAVRSKTIAVIVDGEDRDIALVDVALSKERFVATRAIWDMNTIYEVFLTRAEPSSIGLSSIGARLQAVSLTDGGGLHYRIAALRQAQNEREGEAQDEREGGALLDSRFRGNDGMAQLYVRAPIAPGSVPVVGIESWQRLADGQRVAIERRHSTVALDGERSFSVNPHNLLEIEVRRDGPPVVSVDAALASCRRCGRVPCLERPEKGRPAFLPFLNLPAVAEISPHPKSKGIHGSGASPDMVYNEPPQGILGTVDCPVQWMSLRVHQPEGYCPDDDYVEAHPVGILAASN